MVTTMRVNFHPDYESYADAWDADYNKWLDFLNGQKNLDEFDEETCPLGLLFVHFQPVQEEEIPF
jgi:hypothetical protein